MPQSRSVSRGAVLARVELALVSLPGEAPFEYYRVTLEGASVDAVSTFNRDGRAFDSISFTFRRVTWSHRTQDAAGAPSAPVSACWDVAANRDC